jgi:hypothetical protein
MILRVVVDPHFDKDLADLPLAARSEMWRLIARVRTRPFASGLGYTVSQLRRTIRTGVRVAQFHRDQYRLLFEVDGDLLILAGVGPRPGSYRRLDRLRARDLRRGPLVAAVDGDSSRTSRAQVAGRPYRPRPMQPMQRLRDRSSESHSRTLPASRARAGIPGVGLLHEPPEGGPQ